MDYKYIEELMARYWQCTTTNEEENILKTFFSQPSIPQHLRPYAPLFNATKTLHDAKLSPNFDHKILNHIQKDNTVNAHKITPITRLTPLAKAIAIVAVIFMLSHAAHNALRPTNTPTDYNYDTYEETYTDVNTAYDQMTDALHMISQSLTTVQPDTTTADE